LSVTCVHTDHDDLTVTVIAHFDAPIARVWELWSNPRELEGWWGPPAHPATFEKHDLFPGGEVTYFMTGPDGESHSGMWRVTVVDAPTSLEFDDVYAEADGRPIADMPVSRVEVRLAERESGTRMEMRSNFESREDLEKWLETGTREGLRQAIAQMDALLGP
jgi:uncharacterized protein YndB with AHSA1/START domain